MECKMFKKIVAGSLAIGISFLTVAPVFGYSKSELVYSKINNLGENYKTTVSEHLENEDKNQTLKDLSELFGITNVNGEETFTQNGNRLEWNANGNDIYYQGNTEKELPLECTIKYELNGEEISAEDLLGKSGDIKVTIEYKNKEEHIVNINGTDTKMYTPFVVVAGTYMKNENAKDIKITNGKAVNNGKKTLVLGIACPGLKESLGLSNKDNLDMQIPEKVEIEFNTDKFEMENIISYATPKILDNDDILNIKKLDILYQDIETLSNSSKQIVEGASNLQDGVTALSNGAQTLNSGVSTAYNGSSQMQTQVQQAINNLKSDNGDALDGNTINTIGNQAASQAQLSNNEKSAIGAQAEAQANTEIKNQLSGIEAQAKTQAKNTIEKQENDIKNLAISEAKLTDTQKAKLETIMENYLAQNLVYAGLSAEEQGRLLQTILPTMITLVQSSVDIAAGSAAYETAQVVAQSSASKAANTTAQTVAGNVANTTAQSVAEQTAITAARKTATATASQVANEVKQTAQNSVISQMGTLEIGLSQLTSGLSEIRNGTNSLVSGTGSLQEGATTLSKGIVTFDQDGIQKIANIVNGDVKDLQTRIEKLKDLANEYNSFAGKDEEVEGKVGFIFLIDSIKGDKNNNTDAIVSENELVSNFENKSTDNETTSN